MSRAVYATASILFAIGASIFAYKHLVLEMPVRLDRSARVWRVEMAVSVRGEDRSGRIDLQIPRSDHQQVLLDEQSFDDGLDFWLTDTPEERRASWRGLVGEGHRIAYTFRVHRPPRGEPLPGSLEIGPSDSNSRQRKPAVPAVYLETLQRLRIVPGDAPEAIIATTFGFVSHEIERAPNGSDDARLVLRTREGSALGQARLMVELLRAAGVETRLAWGIRLPRSGRTEVTPFAEAQDSDGWTSLFSDTEDPGDRPRDFMVISRGPQPILKTAGVNAAQLDLTVLRESLPPRELASFVAPESAFWRSLSLYRLPVETQSALLVLLTIPVAVLVGAIFRNLVGIRTFGTFMPILIALSLRRTDLASGLVLVASVVLAGVVGRVLLDRLRLLFVPRICLLLCLVIVFITGLAQLGYQIQGRGLMSGLLFPIVILAMLIERVSVTTLEEGFESTAKLLAGSIALATLVYPVFQSEWLAHLFFGFPELVLCVMAILVLVGGYTGYRISELWRFRAFRSLQKDSQ